MKWAKLLLASAMLFGGIVPAARAQEEKEEECVCPPAYSTLRVFPRGEGQALQSYFGGRARLGVFVNTEANPETDRYGALISGVTDGGPADKAGIREGDIITRLDGESLLAGDEEYDEEQSAPGMRLIERSRKLERGDTIEVEFRRDGETNTVELVAGEFGGLRWATGFAGDPERLESLFERVRDLPEVHVSAPESFAFRLGATLPNLELVSLNPELGEYFGTSEGLLVVSVPEESELNLNAGDVIKEIDGRTVKSPSHAMRILRSYEPDEEVSFRVLRKKKEITVTGRVSEPWGGASIYRLDHYREKN